MFLMEMFPEAYFTLKWIHKRHGIGLIINAYWPDLFTNSLFYHLPLPILPLRWKDAREQYGWFIFATKSKAFTPGTSLDKPFQLPLY